MYEESNQHVGKNLLVVCFVMIFDDDGQFLF